VDVVELVAITPEARRSLWGFLGTLGDQAAEIEIEVADDDAVAFALTDIDDGRFGDERVEHEIGSLVAGPTLRLLDVAMALRARGYAHEGDLTLGLERDRWAMRVRAGRATMEQTGDTPSLTTDTRTLASITFGGLRVRAAAELGLVRGTDDALGLADAMLCLPPFTTVDRF
jgi:predicted acetyltransferase